MNHLCIGSANFGQTYGIKNTSDISSKDIEKIITSCFDNKVYYIDTAPTYGEAQSHIGDILTKYSLNNKAKCISKIDHTINLDNTNLIKSSIQSSLNELQIDSLWALLLHRTPEQISNKFIDLITYLKKENYIENFGISIYDPSDALFFANTDFIDIIQVPFNCLDRRLIDNDFFKICSENNITPIIRSIYLQGALLMSKNEILNSKLEWAKNELGIFKVFCDKNNLDPAGMCLQSVDQYLDDSIIIIGVNSFDEYSKNLNFFKSRNKHTMFDEWWNALPSYGSKLLNPAEW
jgi:aryl-alcohol dehydrogenase-like predicted oxidoreductase